MLFLYSIKLWFYVLPLWFFFGPFLKVFTKFPTHDFTGDFFFSNTISYQSKRSLFSHVGVPWTLRMGQSSKSMFNLLNEISEKLLLTRLGNGTWKNGRSFEPQLQIWFTFLQFPIFIRQLVGSGKTLKQNCFRTSSFWTFRTKLHMPRCSF